MSTEEKKGEIIKRTEQFYNDIKNDISDIVKEFVKKYWKEGEIVFSLGIEYENKLSLFCSTGDNEEIQLEEIDADMKIAEVEWVINDRICGKDNCFVRFFRDVGIWGNEAHRDNRIYYFWTVKNCTKVGGLFFQSIDKVFYEWFSNTLTAVMESVNADKDYNSQFNLEEICKAVCDEFQKQMDYLFDIKLSVITELSGRRYEKEACCSRIVFQLEDGSAKKAFENGIEFKNGIDVSSLKIKEIRKYLQIAKENQYLLARKNDSDTGWQMKGVYTGNISKTRNIIFDIEGHMIWNMEINGEKVIRFECGKYILDCKSFKMEHFYEAYESVFGKRVDDRVDTIVSNAIEQQHGTTVVILEDSEKARGESRRLLEESIGTEICFPYGDETADSRTFLDGGMTKSVTSIDGALLLDQNGKCLGIGVILDSSESIAKDKRTDKGARHTSSQKYIYWCRDKLKIRAIAVVVSEDGPVEIFTTNDIK